MPIYTRIIQFDSETGEIFTETTYTDDYKIKAVHNNVSAAYGRLMDGRMDLHEDERYSKFYGGRLLNFLTDDNVTDGETRMFLACMINCFKYGGEELSYRNNIPLGTTDLIKSSGMTPRSGQRALSGLIEKGILAKEKDGRGFKYYLNPFLVICGVRAEPEAYERFKGSKWAKIRD